MLNFDPIQTEDGFYDVGINAVPLLQFCNLPDGVTLRSSLSEEQECFISTEGSCLVVQIEQAMRKENCNENAINCVITAIKNLATQATIMAEEGVYDNNEMKILYWSYRLARSVNADSLYKKVIEDSNQIRCVVNNLIRVSE